MGQFRMELHLLLIFSIKLHSIMEKKKVKCTEALYRPYGS